MINSKTRFYIFLFLYLVIFLYTTKNVPLFETTEARYAEISREMLVSGDYITPTFDGIKHFHKPPLSYWFIALGMKIFGINNFGARFFGIIFGILSIFILFKLAKLFYDDIGDRINASLIYASSLLFLAIVPIVSTDIYLTFFTTGAYYFLFKQIYGKKSTYNVVFYSIFLSLGFLDKGPIIFLFTLLPYFIAKFFDKGHRKVFSPKEILIGTTIFFLISVPWYIVIIMKNPKLLDYFLVAQVVDRVATNRFHRYKPFYYFFLVFFGTFLPYILFFLKSLFKYKKIDRKISILIIYILSPFFVFSMAESKLSTYILPFYPIASLIAYEGFKKFINRYERVAALIILLILDICIGASAYFYTPLNAHKFTLILMSLFGLFLIFPVYLNIRKNSFIEHSAIFLIFIAACVYTIIPYIGPYIRGYSQMTQSINRLDPQKKLNVLIYGKTLPSVSFYRNKIAVMAYGRHRNLKFETNNKYKKYYIDNEKDMQQFLENNTHFFTIIKLKSIEAFKKKYYLECTKFYQQTKYGAYRCSKISKN